MLYRNRLILSLLLLAMPALTGFTPAQAINFQIRWWYWLILFMILIPLLMWMMIRAAWHDAPPPPEEPGATSRATTAAKSGTNGQRAAQPSPTAAAPAPQQAAPVSAADATDIPEPELIEITDDMDPADVRRARIANAKAEAEYKKALKAAGVDPTAGPAATSASPQAATPAEPTPATQQAPVAVPADIPPPELIEITDDMDPADVRQARIANARAQAEYKKALKAAGVES